MNCERKIWLFLAMASIIVCKLEAFPSGGPKYACRSLTPGHSNGTQPGPPPYRLTASRELLEPRGRTSFSIESTTDFPFRGFICAASRYHDDRDNTVGTIVISPGVQESGLLQTVDCARSTPNTAVTHTSPADKWKVEFDWIAPEDSNPGDTYKFRCTVVQNFYRSWMNIQTVLSVVSSGNQRNPGIDSLQTTVGTGSGRLTRTDSSSTSSNTDFITDGIGRPITSNLGGNNDFSNTGFGIQESNARTNFSPSPSKSTLNLSNNLISNNNNDAATTTTSITQSTNNPQTPIPLFIASTSMNPDSITFNPTPTHIITQRAPTLSTLGFTGTSNINPNIFLEAILSTPNEALPGVILSGFPSSSPSSSTSRLISPQTQTPLNTISQTPQTLSTFSRNSDTIQNFPNSVIRDNNIINNNNGGFSEFELIIIRELFRLGINPLALLQNSVARPAPIQDTSLGLSQNFNGAVGGINSNLNINSIPRFQESSLLRTNNLVFDPSSLRPNDFAVNRPVRNPNSRGLFQSGNSRRFDPNFSRIVRRNQ